MKQETKKEDMMNAYAAGHSMMIRSATEEDLDRVLEIDQLSFPTPWTPHTFKIELKNIFFVIEQKDIIGYLVACICDLGVRAEILRFAVHPDHRGKGVAKELIEATLMIFSKDDFEEVDLIVNSANRSAVKLYEKFGFKITKNFTFLDDQDFHIFYEMKLKFLEVKEMENQLWEKLCPEELDHAIQ
jgi:ribosomal-protein-alanine N-acetyltransferase